MRCALAVLLLCFSLALSLAQAPLEGSPLPSLLASEAPRQTLSQRLDALATRLDQLTTDSASDLATLSAYLTDSSRQLRELRDTLIASQNETQRIRDSLTKSETLLEKWIKAAAAAEAREAQWRKLGLGGLIVGIAGIGAATLLALY